ncbi:MAG: apolipoprotein N-acyltransferase [Ignavibacteria bacterium]|nr:apolipoprotein N-acyltransferase [Ignavibacteria bacterium]
MKTPSVRKTVLLCLFTGIVLGLAFPPFNLSYLIIAGYAIFIGIIHNSKNYKSLFIRAYIVFLFYDLVALSWIALSGMRENADRFLVLGGSLTILIHCVLNQIPVFIYYFIYQKGRTAFRTVNQPISRSASQPVNFSLIFFPFIFTAYEYFMSLTEVSFPWLTTGNAFTNQLVKIQYADITGVFGISVWALSLSVLFYYLFSVLRYSRNNVKNIFSRKSLTVAILIIILFVSPNFYTYFARSEKNYARNEICDTVKIGIIQPNINPWYKWSAGSSDLVQTYIQSIRDIVNKDSTVELIVLPETAVTFYLLYPSFKDRFKPLENIVDSIGIPVLIGFPDMEVHEDLSKIRVDSRQLSNGKYYDIFNAVALLEKNKPVYQKYAKNKLVIGSERMPYQEKLIFLKNLITWGVGISSYQIGLDTTIFNTGNLKFNTAICYESIYPEFFSKFVKKGAEFCVIVTNDGWWGKLPGTHQHNQFAVLRAIENRRWLVRCANTGISGVIDPYGNLLEQTKINEEAIIITALGLRDEITFYTMHGDYVGRYSLYLTVLIFIGGVIMKFINGLKKK